MNFTTASLNLDYTLYRLDLNPIMLKVYCHRSQVPNKSSNEFYKKCTEIIVVYRNIFVIRSFENAGYIICLRVSLTSQWLISLFLSCS